MGHRDNYSLFTALKEENPLIVVGTINAYTALLAKNTGFKAIYISGAGVANADLGLPDLGITNLQDVITVVSRITYVCDLPLLVDIDTGWGSVLTIERAVKSLIYYGAAGLQIEDQIDEKKCGHLEGKKLVSKMTMCDRIKACVDARSQKNFAIVARTDAFANEGLEATIERANSYVEVGADVIFAEALTKREDFVAIAKEISVPVLANMTEFGKTPLYSQDDFKNMGIKIILYPLTAFRAMNRAALQAYECIRNKGTQKPIIESLETRQELYKNLDYDTYKEKIDQ